MYQFRVRWELAGAHYRCRLFSRPGEGVTSALLGQWLCNDLEFSDLQKAMPGVEFRKDDPDADVS